MAGCLDRFFPGGYLAEFKHIFKLAWPMILIQCCQTMLGPIALIFCGHLGKIELDAVALANSIITVTVITTATGLATACDTMFSQTFGSQNKRKLGISLQKSLFTLTLVCLPVWGVHLNTGAILLKVGQHPEVARLAETYMYLFLPGALAFFIYISLAKYLQTQSVVIPNVVIGLITNMCNAGLHYILVYYFDHGIQGSAIALATSYILMMLLTLVYILVSGVYRDTWEGWKWECLQNWGSFCKLALFGLLMICIGTWSFEIGIFVAGILGTTELGAQSVIYQFENIWFMFPFGSGIAASIRVGQCLGAGNADSARAAGWVTMTFMWGLAAFVAVLFASLKDYLPLIFTNVSDVSDLAASVLPVLAMFTIVDTTAGVGSGIMRGCGKQSVCTVILTIAYTTALTAGINLMFITGKGIIVYWLALVVAVSLAGACFLFFVYRIDWEAEVIKARTTTEREKFKRESIIEDGTIGEKVPLVASVSMSKEDISIENGTVYIYDKQFTSGLEPNIWKLLLKRFLTFILFLLMFVCGLLIAMLDPVESQAVNDNQYITNCTLPHTHSFCNTTWPEHNI